MYATIVRDQMSIPEEFGVCRTYLLGPNKKGPCWGTIFIWLGDQDWLGSAEADPRGFAPSSPKRRRPKR